MFVGREKELSLLEQKYGSGKFEFVVIYGRRRVGKTELIRRFIQDRRAIYYVGIESNAGQNLENLSRAIAEADAGTAEGAVFVSFQAALEHVFQLSQGERLILAIDEYPYVARSEQSFASVLQRLIDQYRETSRLMLILCGSSMSYMEDHVLAYKAPLYGRRTGQLKIEPFGFAEAIRCFSRFSDEDLALAYGIAGGTPQYLLQMDDRLSVEDNIKNTFLNPGSFLYEEPENLLKQEVREPAVYTAVISAVAAGAGRLSEIAGKIGEGTSACTLYLRNLQSLGLIRRETPYGEKKTRRSHYVVKDNMFRFWYRFIPGNQSLIVRGGADSVYRRIAPQLPDYMGRVFEEICAEYLWLLLLKGKMPVEFQDLGRWWGTDPATRRQEEIDLMGEENSKKAFFAECKWTKEKADAGVLEKLARRSRLFPYTETELYLFARTGFTEDCRRKAEEMGNVRLVSYGEMMEELRNH